MELFLVIIFVLFVSALFFGAESHYAAGPGRCYGVNTPYHLQRSFVIIDPQHAKRMNTVELLEHPAEPFKMAIASSALATLVVVAERLKSSSVPPLKYGEPWHSRTGLRYPAGVQADSLTPRFFLEADRGTCRRRPRQHSGNSKASVRLPSPIGD
jgi:hypothetical protein